MNIKIEFIEKIVERTIPVVKLTKSKNGKTGTATFVFVEPTILKSFENETPVIGHLSLICDNKSIITNDISIFFKEGKPFLIKAIFIFKNSKEWFNFLSFMHYYSKETGLSFSETSTSFNKKAF
jgi:photosystem II protein